MKLTNILERLADYCDDMITPKSNTFLIAKVKQHEEKKQTSPTSTKQRQAMMPSINIIGKIPKEFPDYRNGSNIMANINGPVRIIKR